MTCAVTTSRGADNPHTGHSCQRSARVLGTAAPHTHTWLVPRGSTFTSSRPALAALYQSRSEEHTSELQSRLHLVCRLLLEKKNSKASLISSGASGLLVAARKRKSGRRITAWRNSCSHRTRIFARSGSSFVKRA